MDQIIEIIAGRLEEAGIDPVTIPSCIDTLVNIIFIYPVLNCQELNRSMQSLAWHNFEIDEHTFKLIKLISDNTETASVLG